MTSLLTTVGALAMVAALAHPQGRQVLLLLAWWPLRDLVRRDWDDAEGRRVARRREWLS